MKLVIELDGRDQAVRDIISRWTGDQAAGYVGLRTPEGIIPCRIDGVADEYADHGDAAPAPQRGHPDVTGADPDAFYGAGS